MNLQLPPGGSAVETDKLVIKGLSSEEFEDLKCLQFVVRAHPLATDALCLAGGRLRPCPRRPPASGGVFPRREKPPPAHRFASCGHSIICRATGP
jgi:hypothetical protein